MLIFGYGSLVNVEHLQNYLGRTLVPSIDFSFCKLQNFRRCWTVAMDNRLNVPGYKHYVDKHNGQRPHGFITFLNIRPCSGHSITGIVFQVSPPELDKLDQRERNYRKLEVTDLIDGPVFNGPVFNGPVTEQVYAYIGLAESEQRYRQGLRQKTAMICQDYYNLVYGAYESLGPMALSDYVNTTDVPEIPIVDLEKRPIPDVPNF